MKVGHIILELTYNGIGDHFVNLVESLAEQGVAQHVVLSSEALGKRLALYDNVTVGPPTGTAVIAYCLMPPVDVVHTHDEKSAQAGLLLALTRSIPFVHTHHPENGSPDNPVARSAYRRASGVICTTESTARDLCGKDASLRIDVVADIRRDKDGVTTRSAGRAAAEHVRIYHRATDRGNVPALLL